MAPRIVVILALTGAFCTVATSCGPKRGLPPTDMATGKPVDTTAADGQPSGATAREAEKIQPRGTVAYGNDSRISRSRGTQGGVLLLWPRVIPSSRTAELRYAAQPVQAALYQLIQKALPGRAIEARPEPERVCPQAGCVASSVGVLLLASKGGCAAIVQTSRPGRGPATQTPWAGSATLRSPTVPFREPPESYVRISDFVPCKDIAKYLKQRESVVLGALRALP